MKRLATAAVAGLVALVGLVGAAPANAADGYGGATVKVTISHKAVEEKEDFTLKASVKSSTGHSVDCDKITYEFRGDKNTSGKFTAPRVSKDRHFPIAAYCSYDADTVTLGGAATGPLPTFVIIPGAVEKGSNTILVLDNDKGNGHGDKNKKNKDDDDDNGNLPNTGGERLAWLVIGLLLVAAGSTVVVSSRKRDSVV